MKDTVFDFLKSKLFWGVLTLQIIAIEPYIPMIKEYLPAELGYISTLVLPVIILWAKVIRDKGVLDDVMKNKNKDDVKEAVKEVAKKKVKTEVKKKVTQKIGEQVNKNNKSLDQGE